MTPTAGEPAPDFALADDTGATVRLADLRGRPRRPLLLPEGRHAGLHAPGVRAPRRLGPIEATGAQLFGVSPDDVESHVRFRDKFGLPFPLLADTDHAALEAYGVLGRAAERQDRRSCARRSLIDEDGTIERVWSPVDPGRSTSTSSARRSQR